MEIADQGNVIIKRNRSFTDRAVGRRGNHRLILGHSSNADIEKTADNRTENKNRKREEQGEKRQNHKRETTTAGHL